MMAPAMVVMVAMVVMEAQAMAMEAALPLRLKSPYALLSSHRTHTQGGGVLVASGSRDVAGGSSMLIVVGLFLSIESCSYLQGLLSHFSSSHAAVSFGRFSLVPASAIVEVQLLPPTLSGRWSA